MEILLRTIGSVLFFVMLYMVFVLGGRWQANETRLSIERTGEAVIQYGDTAKVKIVGKIIK